jgi:hypothetical protein
MMSDCERSSVRVIVAGAFRQKRAWSERLKERVELVLCQELVRHPSHKEVLCRHQDTVNGDVVLQQSSPPQKVHGSSSMNDL